MKKITDLIIRYILFNILIALPPLYAQLFLKSYSLLVPYFWIIFIVSAIMNITVYLMSVKGMDKSPESSIKNFMGGTGVKFFLWMVMIFIYLYNIDVNSRIFLLDFFYIYFFHTVFEISSLLRNLRNQNLR